MKSLTQCINESLLGRAKYTRVNKFKDKFFDIIKPYMSQLKNESVCPLWCDMLNTIEKTNNLQVILLFDRYTLMSEIENIIPPKTDGHDLVELFNKIEKISDFWF